MRASFSPPGVQLENELYSKVTKTRADNCWRSTRPLSVSFLIRTSGFPQTRRLAQHPGSVHTTIQHKLYQQSPRCQMKNAHSASAAWQLLAWVDSSLLYRTSDSAVSNYNLDQNSWRSSQYGGHVLLCRQEGNASNLKSMIYMYNV